MRTIPYLSMLFFLVSLSISAQGKKYKALIIDGENNHGIWPKTTVMMKDYLEQTKLFKVDVFRSQYTWQGPHFDPSLGLSDVTELLDLYPIKDGRKHEAVKEPVADDSFRPEFKNYDLVVTNFGWRASEWPEETRIAFESYMKNGGGLVVVHAANNSFGDWEEYNKMIGIGGWGGRSPETSSYHYINHEGRYVSDHDGNSCGSHGAQQEFVITNRAPDHPIMKGFPTQWLHAKDELYDRLCGPGENMTILATAFSDPEGNGPPWVKEVKGSGRNEPMLMALDYGKGKVFHTALGHMDYSMECVGFIVSFQRGAEWAASGTVTQPIPKDLPSKEKTSSRKWKK